MVKEIIYKTGAEQRGIEGIVAYLKSHKKEATEPSITKHMLPEPPSNTQYRISKLERHGIVKRSKEIDGRIVDINNVRLLREDFKLVLLKNKKDEPKD